MRAWQCSMVDDNDTVMKGTKLDYNVARRTGLVVLSALLFGTLFLMCQARAQSDGFLNKAGQRLFPIGIYELPPDDAKLKMLAGSGINLVPCRDRKDLNRAAAVGLFGWATLDVQSGATEPLRKQVELVKDHPALAAWEGPDEVVWNFTAASELFRKKGVHQSSSDWWKQTPAAVEYAEKQAQAMMPRLQAGIEMIRKLDGKKRPFWINEAVESDVSYVRQYLDFVDITGCDLYPIRAGRRPITNVGRATDRWNEVGRGKPVWMVLQAFSWNELGLEESSDTQTAAYPTFAESRFMAYDVIVHGAKGILYWGSAYLTSDTFRESLYALTSELAALQPFLTATNQTQAQVAVIESKAGNEGPGVKLAVRKNGGEWLIILVNEDTQWHMGVEVSGLGDLNGQDLVLLYAGEKVRVERGAFVTRMPPLGVKLFSTSPQWATARRAGRDFVE
jgi:hypothetical protein